MLAAMAFNLTRAAGALASLFHARATTATIRRQLINVPARPVRSARRIHLRLPKNWPWGNWKFAVDNVVDWYHAQITHMSVLGMFAGDANAVVENGGLTDTLGNELKIPSGASDGMDDLVLLAEYVHVVGGPKVSSLYPSAAMDQTWRTRPDVVEALEPVGVEVAGHPNLFPNLWVVPFVSQIALRIPVSPTKTEMWWFSFMPKNATPQERAMNMFLLNHGQGPAGLFEQEDGENWAQQSLQVRGRRSQRIPQLLKMNLGRGEVIKEHGLARSLT